VEGLLTPLLGKPAIRRLDLIHFVDGIDHGEGHDWKKVYPYSFHELGAGCSAACSSGTSAYCSS